MIASTPPNRPQLFPQQYSTAGISLRALSLLMSLGPLLSGLSSCASRADAQTARAMSLDIGSSSMLLAQAWETVEREATAQAPPEDAITVTVYRLDNLCQDFVPEEVQVSSDKPITDAIGSVLRQQDIIAFDVSSYRVQASADRRTITIDMRLSPDSQRQLVSLSDCEQQAIFGSLRKTLLQPTWDVQQVIFTQRGRPLVL